jgi:hypothetical protein
LLGENVIRGTVIRRTVIRGTVIRGNVVRGKDVVPTPLVTLYIPITTRVARFFLVQTFQIGKNITNDHIYTYICIYTYTYIYITKPNGHKLYQMCSI